MSCMWMTLERHSGRNPVETDDTTVQRLVELEAHFLHQLHVNNIHRVVVVRQMLAHAFSVGLGFGSRGLTNVK